MRRAGASILIKADFSRTESDPAEMAANRPAGGKLTYWPWTSAILKTKWTCHEYPLFLPILSRTAGPAPVLIGLLCFIEFTWQMS
jgi:hypothetical protein